MHRTTSWLALVCMLGEGTVLATHNNGNLTWTANVGSGRLDKVKSNRAPPGARVLRTAHRYLPYNK